MTWLTASYGFPVWLWLVIFAGLALLYWFVVKPMREASSSNDLDDAMRATLIRATNDALEDYRPTVGENNLASGNDQVTIELKANGELYIKTLPGLSVRLLRGYTIAATQGHDNLGDSSPIIYVGESLAKTELPPMAQAKKGVRIGFSNLLKPTAVAKTA